VIKGLRALFHPNIIALARLTDGDQVYAIALPLRIFYTEMCNMVYVTMIKKKEREEGQKRREGKEKIWNW